jgi:hypothetical protein
LFVVAPDDPTEQLLERLADARRLGATLLTIDGGDSDLAGLAHDQLIVPSRGLTAAGEPSGLALALDGLGLADIDLSLPEVSFDTVQHLVSAAAGDDDLLGAAPTSDGRIGFRDRLARALDSIQGSPVTRDW